MVNFILWPAVSRGAHFSMRSYSLLLLVFVSGVTAGDDLFGMRLTTESLEKKESTQYRFHYFVKDDTTGDYKIQQETKHGDLVQGSYTLAEPNGDLRTVTYKAGPGKGFEAKVDVQPSGSPMKQTTKEIVSEATTENLDKIEKPIAVESSVKHFPGGFKMDVSSKPEFDKKTEMGMKFSLKTSSVTAPVLSTTNAVNKITEKREATTEVTRTTHSTVAPSENVETSAVENTTENIEINEEEFIKKEIDEAINFLPKLPELVLSDNKTRFKFYKDPEEALLDERISQIARQLAETSLRREYEERKLGHFIPISVSSVEPSTTSYKSKSFKYTEKDAPNFRPSKPPSTLHVLTQFKIIPQYIYKQNLIPNLPPANHRLPVVSKPAQITKPLELQTQEMITNPPDILKINKFENKPKKKETETTAKMQPVSLMPLHVPTLMQFFTPYVMHTPGSYITPSEPNPQLFTSTVKKDLTTSGVPVSDDTLYSPFTIASDHNTEKPLKV